MNVKIPQFQIPAWLAPHVAEVRSWSAVEGPNPTCHVTSCDRSVFALGLCYEHRHRFRGRARRAGVLLADWLTAHAAEVTAAAPVGVSESVCWVAACGRGAVANGLCKAHGAQARRRFRKYAGVGPASDEETERRRAEA